MNIVVINFSGNVGKSTISKYLLQPRIENTKIIPVENINFDGSKIKSITGKQFSNVHEMCLILDNAIIDVGASTAIDFINQMKKYEGSHEDFDCFIVPVVCNEKQQRDTISTIQTLSSIGVPSEKIKIIFNMVEDDEDFESIFSAIYEFYQNEKLFQFDEKIRLYKNEIFDILKKENIKLSSLVDDNTDYKELIKGSTEKDKQLEYAKKIGIRRLATGVHREMNKIFDLLFSKQ